MKNSRIPLNNGGWFQENSAICFNEDQQFDGRNMISRATGSQWDHQSLYYTRGGNFVLNEWSQYQGSLETYDQIDETEAIEWLIAQNCADSESFAALPKAVAERVAAGVVAAEV